MLVICPGHRSISGRYCQNTLGELHGQEMTIRHGARTRAVQLHDRVKIICERCGRVWRPGADRHEVSTNGVESRAGTELLSSV
jgi:hypothetical protein